MNKPVAKNIDWEKRDGWSKEEQVGYNQACNDWEIYHNHVIDTEYTKNSKIVDFLEKHIHEMYVKKSELPTVEEMADIQIKTRGCKPFLGLCEYTKCIEFEKCRKTVEALHARINQPSPQKSGDSGGESGKRKRKRNDGYNENTDSKITER